MQPSQAHHHHPHPHSQQQAQHHGHYHGQPSPSSYHGQSPGGAGASPPSSHHHAAAGYGGQQHGGAAGAAGGSGNGNGSASAGACASGAHVPTLSRRITACDLCRSRKVKCLYPEGADGPPCIRCLRSCGGVRAAALEKCKVQKNLQDILDGDKAWKLDVDDAIAELQAEVSALKRQLAGGARSSASGAGQRASSSPPLASRAPAAKRRRFEAAGHDELEQDDEDEGEAADGPAHPSAPVHLHSRAAGPVPPGMAPAGSAPQLAHTLPAPQPPPLDGETMDALAHKYAARLDSYAYDIVGGPSGPASSSSSAASPASSSSSSSGGAGAWRRLQQGGRMQKVAACAIAAMHSSSSSSMHLSSGSGSQSRGSASAGTATPAVVCDRLYSEYIRLAALQAFSRDSALADIKALVLGSFHFRELSWILTSIAVRIATERGLQESYKRCLRAAPAEAQAPGETSAAQRRAYEEARLYYQIYVADHVASIPHGRPPLTRQHAAIRRARDWLQRCSLTGPDDDFLISQVELHEIAHDVLDEFGVDVHERLNSAQIGFAVKFRDLLYQWRYEWQATFEARRASAGAGASATAALQVEAFHRFYYHAMRLWLGAHAFRCPEDEELGLDAEVEPGSDAATLHEMALCALQSAHYILRAAATSSGDAGAPTHAHAPDLADRVLGVKDHLRGLPLYAHTMVGFAAVFLGRVSRAEDTARLLGCEPHAVLHSIEDATRAMERLAHSVTSQHIAHSLAPGLKSLAADYRTYVTVWSGRALSVGSSRARNSTASVSAATSESASPGAGQSPTDPIITAKRTPSSSVHFPTASGTKSVLMRNKSALDGAAGKGSVSQDRTAGAHPRGVGSEAQHVSTPPTLGASILQGYRAEEQRAYDTMSVAHLMSPRTATPPSPWPSTHASGAPPTADRYNPPYMPTGNGSGSMAPPPAPQRVAAPAASSEVDLFLSAFDLLSDFRSLSGLDFASLAAFAVAPTGAAPVLPLVQAQQQPLPAAPPGGYAYAPEHAPAHAPAHMQAPQHAQQMPHMAPGYAQPQPQQQREQSWMGSGQSAYQGGAGYM